MKKQLLVLSLLSLGLQGVAHATYPADAEASYSLPASETYADRQVAKSGSSSWGVSMRSVEPHNPFPFGGGYIDD